MQDMIADRDISLATKTRLLEDKNLLARELQRRVRNNLRLVHGMLSQQMQTFSDEVEKQGLQEITLRIMTLAQVYDHLLGIGLSRTIDFGSYLSSLCSNIESLQTTPLNEVVLTCRSVSLTLDLDGVTALGLVISELISNSYKHAFPSGKGTIEVTLSADQTRHEATIFISDNGVGSIDTSVSKRHGVNLVKRLMEQVRGSAERRSDHGTHWTLRFPTPAVDASRQ